MAKLALRWTKVALGDIEQAFEFIVADARPEAAKNVIAKILSGIEQVRVFPELGRAGRVVGTRELVISTSPFFVVYREKKGAIEILAILHQSRKWL